MKYLCFLFFVISCAKDSNFLHHYEPVKSQKIQLTQQIKELHTSNNGEVDILWVIDNSASMGPHQQNLIRNAQAFMDEFSRTTALKWRMGMVSTDTRDAPFLGIGQRGVFDFHSPNPTNELQDAIYDLGTSGSGYEKTFEPIISTLENYPQFLRANAWLIIISVTDANEQSVMSVAEFEKNLDRIRGISKVKMFGVFGAQDLGCVLSTGEDHFNYTGSKYKTIIDKTKGSYFPVCAHDFGKKLVDLGTQISQLVTFSRIPLPNRPKLTSLNLTYKGQILPGGPKNQGGLWYYDYNSNSVIFYDLDFALGDNEAVTINYEIDNGL